MTEQEWTGCGDVGRMLSFLWAGGHLSERKQRLFACACARRLWPLLGDGRNRRAVEVAERYADGEAGRIELEAALREAYAARFDSPDGGPHTGAAYCALETCRHGAPLRLEAIVAEARRASGLSDQADLLRDLLGPGPFRPLPALPPAVLTRADGLVVELARSAREHRLALGHLDPARLAVLADALEEAGAGGGLVEHLRAPGPHVRGCHVVDLLLNKG
jgi:hypothetical protein